VSAAASIGAAVVLPLVGALAVVATGRRANLRDSLTVGVSLLTFATVASLVSDVSAGGRPELELLTVVPGLVLAFQLEPLGMLFGLVASGLWIVTSIYGFGYMRGHHEKNQTRFFACFAIAISAALGIAFARNLFTLFLFYEVLTFSTYPLVTHHGTEKAMRAGRVYLGLLVSTSVLFLLFAVVWTYVLAGTLEFVPGGILRGRASDGVLTLLLALFAFGLGKAALMPFHRWLPAAMVAPTPVSALLHAVAVVKAGVFSMLKVLIYIFGIDMLHETGISFWLMVVASFSILVASVRAIGKDNLKARLAYSTISQLSYITLGAALATSSAVVGAALHIAMHAMGKITLFFCAGAIYVATDKTEVSQMAGLGKRMPVTLFAFFVGSLSIIGLPPGGGAWSKWYLMLGAAEAHEVVFIGVLMLSSLLSIAYLMPVVARGFFAPAPEGEGEGIREAPLMVLLPLCFTAAGCVLLFFLAPDIYALLLPIAASGGG
jgi:multicomponent Na+:H+ antiporter subunit D